MTNTPEEPFTHHDLVRWGEALSGLARTGLAFTDNSFERERYEEILNIAAEIRVAVDTGIESVDLREQWLRTVEGGVPGYVTPKVGVAALVGNDAGELLLIQRADAGVWLYPTGWADVGYSPAEVAVKEVAEETGLEVEPVRLVAVLDGMRFGMRHIPMYSLVFQCRLVGGTLKAHEHECLDVGFFAESALPEPLARNGAWAALAFSAIRGEVVDTWFDPPRNPTWRA